MYSNLNYINPSVFGSRVKERRLSLGVQQNDMAMALGMAKSSLSAYESGVAVPSLDKTYMIAEFLHVSVDYLLGRDEVKSETISTLSDMAGVLDRLLEFEGLAISEDEKGDPQIVLTNGDLLQYYRDYLLVDRLKESGANPQDISRLRNSLFKGQISVLSNVPAEKKRLDDDMWDI